MANTIDQMQDVFPVSFDFVKGEQPTATKLTGWVKQTDTAFARMTKAIGDPWEYTAHSGTGGVYFLSPGRLAQASLARIIGPSDYVSPRGSSFQEAAGTVAITLPSYRNTWNVGFPLVSLSSDILPTDSGMSKISKLTWGVDITVSVAPTGLFVTEVASPDAVQSSGEFYVDYYTGTITTYGVATSAITLSINNLHMFGPGVPWGTSNIIPHWNSSANLCWVTEISTAGGTTLYNVALPTVISASRDTTPDTTLLGAIADADTAIANIPQWNVTVSGSGAQYRMPVSLTSNLTPGDQIPEGFMYVWDESTGRIVPQTEFYYLDETNVRVQAPAGWLTLGGSVRLILTGTSITEAIQYLMSVQREGRHLGLSTGQHQDTLHYTVPINHNDLVNSFSGSIPSSISEPTKYYFRESSHPINPHPQYIHRAGYMSDDEEGNSGNAMRGYLAFTGRYEIASSYDLGPGTSSGTMGATYGIIFGGGTTTTSSQNARLSWEGGENVDTWTNISTTAHRLGFGLNDLGAQKTPATEYFGALTYTPWQGLPFYIKGIVGTAQTEGIGAVIGFDFGDYNEMNYIKLVKGYRAGSYDVPNQACLVNQSLTSALSITPGLTGGVTCNRLSAEQVREFRFRGGAYESGARNANDGLGSSSTATAFDISISHDAIQVSASGYYLISGNYTPHFRVGDSITASGFTNGANNGTKTITGTIEDGANTVVNVSGTLVNETPSGATIVSSVNEFNAYFTSPGMVGADFINVYSNAIFFSDTGDGATTSFTDRGNTWMDTGAADSVPSGMYYFPQGTYGPYFAYAMYDSSLSASSQPLSVGDRHGFWYTSHKQGPAAILNYDSNIVLASGFDYADLTTRVSSIRSLNDGGKMLLATGDYATQIGVVGLSSASSIGIQIYASDTYPDIRMQTWDGDIRIATYTSGNITIDSTDGAIVQTDGTLALRSGLSSNPFTISGQDIGIFSNDEIYLYSNVDGGVSNNGIRMYAGEYDGLTTYDHSQLLLLSNTIQLETRNISGSTYSQLLMDPSGDITIKAEGGNLNLNPTGTNNMIILGTYVKSTTGDPSGSFSTGALYINTSDHVLKMYAESAWRTIASW